MRFVAATVVTLSLGALSTYGLCDDGYLTKEGQLTQSLKIVQTQGGFAGYTGTQYTIAPDGTWNSASVFNEKLTPKAKGKLAGKELGRLAATFAKFDLAGLPEKTGTPPGANPHTITIEYGKSKAVLVGRTPPKLDPAKPAESVESRFAGTLEEVSGLLAPPKEK